MARIYWKFRRPVTMGSRVIVINDGKLLLVRLSYQQGWYLPGGGVKRGESFQEAAIRELAEECGLKAVRPRLLQLFTSRIEGKIDYIALFECTEFTSIPDAKPDAEILEARFFSLDDLPEGTSPATLRRIREYCSNDFSSDRW